MLKNPRPRFLMIALSLGAVLAMMLGACGAPSQGSGPTTTTQSNAKPVKGGTWIDDLYEEPSSLIPNASSETFANMVDQAIYTPLFVGDSNSVVRPALATEIPTVANGGISADYKTWTFHIRKGVTWSDGQPLDARDVAFTAKIWNDPKFGAASTTGINLIDLKNIKVSADNLSVSFTLKDAFAPFISAWVDGLNAPLPMHRFQGMAADAISKSADNLNPTVTSGPFMIKEAKPGDHFTLVRNPKYYRASEGLPYLDSVVFRIVSDQNTILKDLQAGTVDSSWFLDVSKSTAYKKLNDYKLTYAAKTANFEALFFNFNNKILGQNVEVRRAISMAVDNKALISVARRGLAAPLCTVHGPSLNPGYQADAKCPTFDLAAANKLLEDNGWKLGADNVRSKNGQRLEFMYSSTANNLWRRDDELINQQNFAKIGVKINLQNYPASTFFGTFLPDGKAGKYDMAEYEQSWGYDPDDSTLLACDQIPPNGQNYDFYCNRQLDALYKKEQQTVDPAARQQIFNQIHTIQLTDVPLVVLYSPFDIAMVKNGARNYAPAPGGASETINIWEWWCDNGKCPA